jgi:serine/threonine protein kinase
MTDVTYARKGKLADQYGNQHQLGEELARGGQGVVYRTGDADLAIKQPLGPDGEPDRSADLQQRFQGVRCLPLPPRIPLSLPLAVLRDPEPGYVMKLLSDMSPFSAFELGGDQREVLASESLPTWLAGIKDKNTALPLVHYAKSGSTKRRLLALAKAAAVLGRLHAAGLVYGDISPNNCFMGSDASLDVWLIDADNLRFELMQGGSSVFTPRYGAPEIVKGTDRARPRTDAWAFAVMAFETLALVHPFIGKRVLDPDEDDGGWDAEPVADGAPTDLDEQAYTGYLPFVDDENDDSNRAVSGLPRGLVLTPNLAKLFQETFGAGRTKPWRRPAMAFWAQELTRAHDLSIACSTCSMSYQKDHTNCPYCAASRPAFATATTDRWQMVVQELGADVRLPHRLFHPFSLELNGRTEHEAVLDCGRRSATHVRGTEQLPASVSFEFVEEVR